MAIAIAVIFHLPTLAQPLLEAHSFRQTQTALTALIFHESGIDLLHPKLPILGAPWEVPFEFPLFQAMASLVMDAGLAPDVALRGTALATFAITAVLVWRLTVRLAGDAAALVGLLAFLISPFALLWSRASMIEYLATAAGVGFVLFTLEWHEKQRRVFYAVAMVAGAIAMLVKAPTGAVFVLPVLAVPFSFGRLRRLPSRQLAIHVVAMLSLVAVPLALGILWTRHADAVKAASEFTGWLTSSGLSSWNFGTLAQKLSLSDWQSFVVRWNDLMYGGAIWLWTPLALIGAVMSKRRAVAVVLVASAWIGPIVFTNLYFVHDYYLAAISPLVAIGIGLAAGWLWARRQSRVSQVIALVLGALWAVQMIATQGYWAVQFQGDVDVEEALVAARQIEANSDPGERVVVTGRDWSSAALYYSRRWGLMFHGTPATSLANALDPQMVEQLRSLGYTKVFHCPYASPDGCTRIIDLNNVDDRAGTTGFARTPPEFLAGATIGYTDGRCNMETLNGRPWSNEIQDVGSGESVAITGWAMDGGRQQLARATYLRLHDEDGRTYYATTSRVDRPDVGAYLGDDALKGAGYEGVFLPRSVPFGEYNAVVVMDTESGAILCDAGRRLRVPPTEGVDDSRIDRRLGFANNVQALNPGGYWRFDTASAPVLDVSGNGNDSTGTIGAPDYGETGLLTGDPDSDAIRYNGNERHLVPDSSDLEPASELTVLWLAKVTALGAGSTVPFVYDNPDHPYRFQLAADGSVEWSIYNASRSTVNAPAGTVVTGGTYLVVGTYDASELVLYVNGEQVAIFASGLLLPATIDYTGGAANLYLGHNAADWDITFSEGAVVPRALSAAEVRNLWESRARAPGDELLPTAVDAGAGPTHTLERLVLADGLTHALAKDAADTDGLAGTTSRRSLEIGGRRHERRHVVGR